MSFQLMTQIYCPIASDSLPYRSIRNDMAKSQMTVRRSKKEAARRAVQRSRTTMGKLRRQPVRSSLLCLQDTQSSVCAAKTLM